MKTFLRGLLTIWLTILLIVLVFVLSVKNVLTDTVEVMVKDTFREEISKTSEELEMLEIDIDSINEVIENNKRIGEIVNIFYDATIDYLVNNTNVNIDVREELDNFIDSYREILEEYNIYITEKDKQELVDGISDVLNDVLEKDLAEFKNSMDAETKQIIDAYVFLTSVTFKLIVIGLIIVTLVLIALLKKSYFKWLSNFGVSSLIGGILLVILEFIITTSLLEQENIKISLDSLSIGGYVLIGLGILSIVLNIVFSKLKESKE